MQAVAEILEYFIEIHNTNMVAGGEVVYSADGVQAYIGADYELYIKVQDSNTLQVTGSTVDHLKKYHSRVIDSKQIPVLAETINNRFNEYAMDLT